MMGQRIVTKEDIYINSNQTPRLNRTRSLEWMKSSNVSVSISSFLCIFFRQNTCISLYLILWFRGADCSMDTRHHPRKKKICDPNASLVVCGVDGTVYTLDACTGNLRGLFASGPALVSSSTLSEDEDESDYDMDQYEHPNENGDLCTPSGNDQCIHETTNKNDVSGTSSEADFSDDEFEWLNDDDQHQNEGNKERKRRKKEQIVPGLDGHIYTLTKEDEEENSGTKNVRLDILPVSVMDVIDSPVSTCSEPSDYSDNDDVEEECGIVMGEKRTKVFSIDVLSGTVKWMQHSSDSTKGFSSTTFHSGGGFSFAQAPRGSKDESTKKRPGHSTVLLQREDYFVRKIDAESGRERWNVTVAKFSALDFSMDQEDDHYENDDMEKDDPSALMTSNIGLTKQNRRKTTAAATVDENKGKGIGSLKSSLLSLSRSATSRLALKSDGDDKKAIILPLPPSLMDGPTKIFPSIAFGEDGTSISAIDPDSGEAIWRRSIDSIVAAVYGVGEGTKWIALDVIDDIGPEEEKDDLFEGFQNNPHLSSSDNLLPGATQKKKDIEENSALISATESERLFFMPVSSERSSFQVQLAMQASTLFVSSSQALIPYQNSKDHVVLNEDIETVPLPPVNTDILPRNSPGAQNVVFGVIQKTEHGLFLTWQGVICIILFGIGVVAGVRVAYMKQRRKWELMSSPNHISTVPNSLNNGSEGVVQATEKTALTYFSLNGDDVNPKLDSSIQKQQYTLARSMSLPQFNSSRNRSDSSSGSNMPSKVFPNDGLFVDENIEADVVDSKLPKLTETGNSTSKTTTTNNNNSDQQEQQYTGVATIDGVPLVRYPRYDSEFKELSALGKGGFGTVFRCNKALEGCEYAIKKIRIKSPVDALNDEISKLLSVKLHRVLREVKVLAVLDHPNIVRYYTAWLELEKSEKDDNFYDKDKLEMITSTGQLESGIYSTDDNFTGQSFTEEPSFVNGNSKLQKHKPLRSKYGKSMFSSSKNNPLHVSGFGSFLSFPEEESVDFDEQKSSKQLHRAHSSDLGFVWDRDEHSTSTDAFGESTENTEQRAISSRTPMLQTAEDTNDDSSSSSSSDDDSSSESTQQSIAQSDVSNECTESTSTFNIKKSASYDDKKGIENGTVQQNGDRGENLVRIQTFILYIQMQLCSQKTLADILASPDERKANESFQTSSDFEENSVDFDIPFALKIFSQIARAVKHVHEQGLIHRDLKPSNCFIDDIGVVKVGDFGLSRTAATLCDQDEEKDSEAVKMSLGMGGSNTSGIGTRSYASPEQMDGSDYDASTDVYSLGIILFELCYPMYTGMERYLVFQNIRKREFPSVWMKSIAVSFPTLHSLLNRMLSYTPSERPSSHEVADRIDALLSEYTVQSLHQLTTQERKDSLLLRVEAKDDEGVLSRTVKLITESSPNVTIVQYSLTSRLIDGGDKKAIMEFAISVPNMSEDESGSDSTVDSVHLIYNALKSNEDILLVRKLTEKHAVLHKRDSREKL